MIRRCTIVLLGALSFVAGLAGHPAEAVVFYSRDEAMALAFPAADRTEGRDFFLTPAQRREIEERARAKVESEFLTVYKGFEGEQLLGYAILDTHLVRTRPETFLVVLAPDGAIEATHVLAFHEPLDYLPSDRWLRLFKGKRFDDDLHVGRGIVGITGSTLTAHAVSGGIRRALAIYDVLLKGN